MLATLIGLVVLISLIAVAFALRKLRDEHMNLRAVVVNDLDSTGQSEESQLATLLARLGALEKKLNQEGDTNGETLSTGNDSQYQLILRSFATLLQEHEVESSEIFALIEGLPEAERQKLMAELQAADPAATHAGLRRRIGEIQVSTPDSAPESASESASESA
ncbi:MAG: hypothetical protein QF405_15060, partial [Roseibacillus sp.]|nr:hypothetical protein [Roseibacillus sp.]